MCPNSWSAVVTKSNCPIAGSTDLVHFADSPGQTHLFGYDGAAGIFWRHEDVDDLFAGYRGYSYRFQRVQ